MKVLMWPAVAADALTLVLSGIYPGTGQVVQSSVKVQALKMLNDRDNISSVSMANFIFTPWLLVL